MSDCIFTSWGECAEHPGGDPATCDKAQDKIVATIPAGEWGRLAERASRAEATLERVRGHEVKVRTIGYGGHVTYCSCGHDGDYADHLRELLGGD